MGKFSPMRSVNPRELHVSGEFFRDYLEPREQDNLSEEEVGGLGGDQLHSTSRSRKSSVQSSPPASSKNDFGAEEMIVVEGEKPGLNSLEDEDNDEVTTVVDSGSRESSSHPGKEDATMVRLDWREPFLKEDDATMAFVESSEPSSQEDDVTMSSVESSEPPSLPQVEGENDNPMVGVESNKPLGPSSELSNLEENDEEGRPTSAVNISQSKEPLSESKEPSSDLSDSGEGHEERRPTNGVELPQSKELLSESSESKTPWLELSDVSDFSDDGESQPTNDVDLSQLKDPLSESKGLSSDTEEDEESGPTTAVESSDSSDNENISSPTVSMKKATPNTETEYEDISDDFATSLHLASQFEPRRSSRNIPAKNKLAVNYVDYVPSRKSSSGKKKLAFRKEGILLASL